jgi:hypothetical protein
MKEEEEIQKPIPPDVRLIKDDSDSEKIKK